MFSDYSHSHSLCKILIVLFFHVLFLLPIYFSYICCVYVCSVTQSCPAHNPMDCSPVFKNTNWIKEKCVKSYIYSHIYYFKLYSFLWILFKEFFKTISCMVDVLAVNSLHFYLNMSLFCFYFWKDNATEYIVLDWQFFSFEYWIVILLTLFDSTPFFPIRSKP